MESDGSTAEKRTYGATQPMTEPDEQLPYRVATEGERFNVIDWEGKVAVVCADASNAGQYAALMNQSYRSGYKAGFRKARKVSP